MPNIDVKFSLISLRYGKLKDFDNQQRCALRTERKEGKETKEIRNYRLTKGKAFSVKEIHYTKKIYFDHYSWSSGAWRISFLGRKGEKSLVLVCPYGESTLGKLKEWLSHSFEMKFVNLPVEELETESYRSEAESDTDSDDFETGSEDDQDEQPKKKAQVSTSSAASSGLRKRKPRSAFKTADADGKKSSHSEKEKET